MVNNNPIRLIITDIYAMPGVVRPSPACKRALKVVVNALKRHGYKVVDVDPPSPHRGLTLGSSLILADGGTTATDPMRSFETNDPGMVQAMRVLRLPSLLRRLYVMYVRYIKRDEVYAGVIEGFHAKNVKDFWKLVAEREKYKIEWWEWWNGTRNGQENKEEKLDFLLTVPNALPAVPHGGMKHGFAACGYTFLFNVVSALQLPIIIHYVFVDFSIVGLLCWSASYHTSFVRHRRA